MSTSIQELHLNPVRLPENACLLKFFSVFLSFFLTFVEKRNENAKKVDAEEFLDFYVTCRPS